MSEQPLEPRALAGPLHRHGREDGFIHALEGSVGAQVEQQVVHAVEGATVMVARGARHAFWNDADIPAKVRELFTPAGLEGWFEELAENRLKRIVRLGGRRRERPADHLELDSLAELLDAYDLRLPGM